MTKKKDAKLAYVALMKCYPLTLDDLPDELWKEFNGYQISTYGRVKSFKRKTPRILQPACNNMGYLYVFLPNGIKPKWFLVHRLVATCFIPNPENKPEVNHIDGHPLNCHVNNLEWCTRSENNQHAYDTGLKAQGEDRSDSKLTNEQARFIRLNPDNLTQSQLAKIFGVSRAMIGDIQLGKTYKQAGGIIRGKIKGRVPDDIRNQIRTEYQKGVRGCGRRALAKKYGIDRSTIVNIIRES